MGVPPSGSQCSGSHTRHVQNQVNQVLKIYRSPLLPFVVGGSPINGSDAFSVSIASVLSVVPPQLYHPVNQPCQLPAFPLLSLISCLCSSSSTIWDFSPWSAAVYKGNKQSRYYCTVSTQKKDVIINVIKWNLTELTTRSDCGQFVISGFLILAHALDSLCFGLKSLFISVAGWRSILYERLSSKWWSLHLGAG